MCISIIFKRWVLLVGLPCLLLGCTSQMLPNSLMHVAEKRSALIIISDNACLSCSKKFVTWLTDTTAHYEDILLVAEAAPSAVDLSLLMDKPHFYYWDEIVTDEPFKRGTTVGFKDAAGEWEFYELNGVEGLSLFEEGIIDRLASL